MDFRRRLRGSRPRPLAAPSDEASRTVGSLIDCGNATALGSRPDNQDRCSVSARWVVLSDGAGGHAGGGRAAELTVDTVVACLESGAEALGPPLVEEAFQRANWAVRSGRQADKAVFNMAATLTVAVATSVADEESAWLVASVGDSRAWLVTRTAATQITEDDNVAAQLLRTGALTPAEALDHPGRHWITRAIGPEDRVAVPTTAVNLRGGDALLVASDGLDVLSAEDIHQTMAAASAAGVASQRLVDSALRNGATDNVTVAVVRHVILR